MTPTTWRCCCFPLLHASSVSFNVHVSHAPSHGGRSQVFRHNDADHLEMLLRESIAEGQPRTRRPWRKVLVIVEGVYSMEGESCNLKPIVEVRLILLCVPRPPRPCVRLPQLPHIVTSHHTC